MEKNKFVNLTPHEVVILDDNKNVVKTFAPSGLIARCSANEQYVNTLDGVKITRQSFGEVQGLPEPQAGTWYIVSRIVAEAVKGQCDDVIVPGQRYVSEV